MESLQSVSHAPSIVQRERLMIRFAAILAFGAVLALPGFSFADCGCGCNASVQASPCDTCNACQQDCCQPKPRTRLKLVRVCKEVCRTKRVCSTDSCGCPTTKRVRVTKRVPRLKLVRVEVPPRQRCCKKPACPCPCHKPAPCGCADPCANTGCGCN